MPLSLRAVLLDRICRSHDLKLIMPYGETQSIVPPLDGVISTLLVEHSYHEKNQLDKACRFLDSEFAVLDIGANVGFWTLPLAKALSKSASNVFAFEPTPASLATLRINIAINQLTNVMVNPVGLSDSAATLSLSVFDAYGTSSGWNTFAALANNAGTPSKTVEAEVRPLDDWWIENGSPLCGFIKIDVEGFETNVLKGGQAFFASHARQPHFFGLMEFNGPALEQAGTSSVALFDALTELGFEVFHLLDVTAKAATRSEFGPATSENVLFAPSRSDFAARWNRAS